MFKFWTKSIWKKKQDNSDHFELLRKIQKNPESSQRQLAEDLGFSLGKLNYCLKALQEKGINVDRSAIKLDEPIKALGIYHIPVSVSLNLEGDVKIYVIKS